MTVSNLDVLFDRVRYSSTASDYDFQWVMFQKFSCETFHMTRKCSGEHDRLTIGSDVLHNHGNLRFESHVEHSIGFVQNKVSVLVLVLVVVLVSAFEWRVSE